MWLFLLCWAALGCEGNKAGVDSGAGGAGNLGTEGQCSPAGGYRCNPDEPRNLEVCDPAHSSDWLAVETCASASLCSAELGACLTCNPGDFQCMAWELHECNAKGSAWELRRTCENEQYCDRVGAQCAACLVGETYCGGDDLSQLYVCNPARTGFNRTDCDRPGDCSTTSMTCRSCVEGEYQCNKQDLQRCNAAQEWEVQDTCASETLCQKSHDMLLADATRPPACEEPACTAGTYQCDEDDGRNLLGCPPSEDAWTVVDVCASAALCEQGLAAGACPLAQCDPGTARCEGLALQVCNADGTAYDTLKTCASSDQCNLVEMDCVACTPGSTQCNGALLQKCSDAQAWVTQVECASASLCAVSAQSGESECIESVCPDAPYRCEGSELQLCDADQMGWTAVKTCDSEDLCNATDARCDTAGCPAAGQTRCQDNALQVCPESLRNWDVQEQCEAGSVCDLELLGCADTCPDPPYRCNNTQPEHCVDGDNGATWEVVSAPCATAALCEANADGASCVTAACGGSLPDYRCTGQIVERCNVGRTGWETALTCPAGSVCDPGPSREGPAQCDVCGADVYVCDDENLMRCEPNGQSQATVANCRDAEHCVAGGDADNSYCMVCDPDETQCNGTQLDVCAQNRRGWVEQDDCGDDLGCHDEVGAADYCNVCPEAGATECADDEHLITCSEDQTSWSEPEECEFGCQEDDDGAYCRDCEPNSIDCSEDDDTERRTCDDAGHWGPYSACPDGSTCFSSDDGDYCGSCDPGEPECLSSTERMVCGDDGNPGATMTCAMNTPYCLSETGNCVQCNPSTDPQCTGAAGTAGRRTCSTAGAWEPANCTTMGSTVCLNGNCVACAPNASICPAGGSASARQVCNAMGVWTDQACTTAGLTTCYQGTCVECNPNTAAPRCTGTDTPGRQTCDSTGHWTPINSTADDCTGANICVGGVCQACNPATQPAECVAPLPGSGRRQCSMGSWSDVSCTAPNPVCSGTSGMAATCVCQNGDHGCNGSVLQTCSMGAWANDPGSPACTACTGNGMCSGQTPACNGEWCVQCTATSHALCIGTTPVCGTNNTCRACAAGECGASAVCDTTTGACVECLDSDASACPPATPACSNKECVECTASDDGACEGTTPICDTSNVCRACEDTAECPEDTTCDVTGACVEDP